MLQKRINKNVIMTFVVMLLIFTSVHVLQVSAHEDQEKIDYQVFDLGTSSMTIDGDPSDWSNVDGVDLTLEQPLPSETEIHSFTANLKVAHSLSDAFFLVSIAEKYQAYNFSTGEFAHNTTVSLAIAFSINASSSGHMGAESEVDFTSTGYVDLVHWELENDAGFVTSGSKEGDLNKGNGPQNLDDEYASSPLDREDDTAENSWTGAWDHTTPINGSLGTYYFELSRKMITNDPNDVQFEMNKKYESTLAFWTPFETVNGWTDSGHFTSSETAKLKLVFGNPPSLSPESESIAIALGILVLITIYRRKK